MRYWSLSECVGCRMLNVVHTCTESAANTVLLAYTQKLTVHILYSAYILWTSSICSFNFQTIFASSRTTREEKNQSNVFFFSISLSFRFLVLVLRFSTEQVCSNQRKRKIAVFEKLKLLPWVQKYFYLNT